MMVVASTRGTTSLRTGFVASARKASICSVTFIVPISAAMPAPTRPPTISAISTGASSRMSESETTLPMNSAPPNSASEYAVCSASTIPMKSEVMADDGDRPHADLIELGDDDCAIDRPADELLDRLRGQIRNPPR